MKNTIQLLKEHNINNFYILKNKIIVEDSIDISSIKKVGDNYFNNFVIKGNLILRGLVEVGNNFLKNAAIEGTLILDELLICGDNFLNNITIKGSIHLRSLIEPKDYFINNSIINQGLSLDNLKLIKNNFLSGTIINGGLSIKQLTLKQLNSLTNLIVVGFIFTLTENNEKYIHLNYPLDLRLPIGYNKEKQYAYFDNISVQPFIDKKSDLRYNPTLNNILSIILNVKKFKDYTIYQTPFDYIVEKNNYRVCEKSLKIAIEEIELKKKKHEEFIDYTKITKE